MNVDKPIVLFEINKGILIDNTFDNWVTHSPKVWKYTFSWTTEDLITYTYGDGAWGYGYYGSTGSDYLLNPSNNVIGSAGSFTVGAENYSQLDSISQVESNNKSFYFDIATQVIYVNFDGSKMPGDFESLTLGVTKGYSNFPVVVNGKYYEPRILSIPSIEQKRDALFFGVVSFEGGSVTLLNTDGELDMIDQEKIYGQPCKIYFSEDGVTYNLVFSGTYESHSYSKNNIIINVKDVRKSLLLISPTHTFELSEFPNLSEDDVGSPIPIGYGTIKKAKGTYIDTGTWKFVDTSFNSIQSIGTVYKDDKIVTPTSSSIANGTVTFSSYNKGDNITVDFIGYNITNPLDIIADLILQFLGLSYNSNFYNTTSWDAAKASITTPVSLYVGDQRGIIDIIGEISQSIFGFFISDTDGRFNFKIVDNEKASTFNIKKIDYIEGPKPKYISKEYISSAKVNYLIANAKNKYKSYTNTSNEESLYNEYKTRNQQEFNTLLINPSAAISYSEKAMSLFGGVFQTWTIVTKMQTMHIELEDIITAELYQVGDEIYTIDLEVIGKSSDYINKLIILTCRSISVKNDVPSNAKFIRS